MVSTHRILVGLLALLVTTEPMMAIPTNRFRSVYKTVRTDIRCLFGSEKIDDPEQKKRIMIEIAAGITIMLATTTVIWIWWVRPLKQQLHEKPKEESFENIPPITNDDGGKSSLQFIFRNGTERFLNEVIKETKDSDLAKQDESGNTALHYAASRDLPEIVAQLIKKLPVNAKNKDDETPLHFAAFSDQKGATKLLIANGADPTIENKDKQTPHQIAENKEIQGILERAEREWAKKDKK